MKEYPCNKISRTILTFFSSFFCFIFYSHKIHSLQGKLYIFYENSCHFNEIQRTENFKMLN